MSNTPIIDALHELVRELRESAEKQAENHRVARFGPAGGDSNVKATDFLEWIAADRISLLESRLAGAADAANNNNLAAEGKGEG